MAADAEKPPRLSLLAGGKAAGGAPLSRVEVADRLGISVSTVRRYEGERLHPKRGADGVHRFEPAEVTALAAELANLPRMRRRIRNAGPGPLLPRFAPRSADEVAAQVFERFEQRHSMAEIVIAVRVDPERVEALYEQWCQGLIERQLRGGKAPHVQLDRDYDRCDPEELAARIAKLPQALTRISVGRYHGEYTTTTPEGDRAEYAWIRELGGFVVSGPFELSEITNRYGAGDYRITAYELEPPAFRWEVLVTDLRAAK